MQWYNHLFDNFRYKFEDDDDAGMEANFATIMKEEARRLVFSY